MFSLPYLSICIYCILQLGFLLFMDNRRRKMRAVQEHYFSLMLGVAILSFLADLISSLYVSAPWLMPFAVIGTYGEILLNISLLPIYFLYVCSQIIEIDKMRKRKCFRILLGLAVLCVGVLLSNVWNHGTFYFDHSGNYHRGYLFWAPMLLMLFMMAFIEYYIFTERRKIEIFHFYSLLSFVMFPLIGWLFQALVYGLPFSLIGITLAAQVVFTNIQNRSMDMDYLTGAYNRRALDSHLQRKIGTGNGKKIFGGLLLDIDNFKLINDTCGHYEGDTALLCTANILREAVGQKDFIARYGGDEFCIISETEELSALEQKVKRIRDIQGRENVKEGKNYSLEFSIGYGMFSPDEDRSGEGFMKRIDQRMYSEKRGKKLEKL